MRASKTKANALELGRKSIQKRAWSGAFAHMSAADQAGLLEPEDLQQFAAAAHLSGREADSLNLLARAHQGYLSQNKKLLAARCAFWLGFIALYNRDLAQANGWLARSRRLLDGESDCAEHGYLLLPVGIRSASEGDTTSACKAFAQAAAIGNRFGDMDLVAIALLGQGRALVSSGEIAQGVALLDEAMVAVTSGEVSPISAGAVYCGVIESCRETFDLRRAQEWTAALHEWCHAQPELVPYRGQCLLQRAEILQLRGEWSMALEEAQRGLERLSQPTPKPAIGEALYRIGELHRMRGEFAEAEEAYRQAIQWQQTPQPGIALLRLAQGRLDAAKSAMRRLLGETQRGRGRFQVLEAHVEIALAAKDVSAAQKSARELSKIADMHGAPLLRAAAARASGAVLLATGKARKALDMLRQSCAEWCELVAPYEAARVRVLIALACRELGDHETAEQELASARSMFKKLRAAPDLAHTDALLQKGNRESASPLSSREAEVLKLVASGITNRKIAERLFISEKTVARHMNNIFDKLDLSSRTAATAYAYRNNLV